MAHFAPNSTEFQKRFDFKKYDRIEQPLGELPKLLVKFYYCQQARKMKWTKVGYCQKAKKQSRKLKLVFA